MGVWTVKLNSVDLKTYISLFKKLEGGAGTLKTKRYDALFRQQGLGQSHVNVDYYLKDII